MTNPPPIARRKKKHLKEYSSMNINPWERFLRLLVLYKRYAYHIMLAPFVGIKCVIIIHLTAYPNCDNSWATIWHDTPHMSPHIQMTLNIKTSKTRRDIVYRRMRQGFILPKHNYKILLKYICFFHL